VVPLLHPATLKISQGETMPEKKTRLSRPIHPMSDAIRTRLEQDNLLADFFDRPAYQQNDYLLPLQQMV